MSRYSHTRPRVALIQVLNPHEHHHDETLEQKTSTELHQLVATFGGDVVASASQHRTAPHPSTYIGGGKVEWLKQQVRDLEIDVIILNNVANAGQLFRLEQIMWEVNPQIKVWDRIDLILHIFDLHANTLEAKLQIELARIHHLGPRIYGLGGTVLSRQGAGTLARGAGETNAELERRKIKTRKQHLQKELSRLESQHLLRIADRKDRGIPSVALVGYTSAGKTTVFNILTGKEKSAHHSLFTTLDSVIGKMKSKNYLHDIMVSDTIGFIENLPPTLIKAFRSTLLESLEADLLLHVIDANDAFLESKCQTVEDILLQLHSTTPRLIVFNKVDLLSTERRAQLTRQFASQTHIFVSAKTGTSIETLKVNIQKELQSLDHHRN